jgi:hypothetical protein
LKEYAKGDAAAVQALHSLKDNHLIENYFVPLQTFRFSLIDCMLRPDSHFKQPTESMNTKELCSRYAAGQRDFRNLNLMAANFRNMNLSGINLSGANLTKANLTRTNLSYANLTDAILVGANLSEANFTRANLTNANLSHAIVTDTNFNQSYLRGATLPDDQPPTADKSVLKASMP